MIYLIGVNHALQHDGKPPHEGPSLEILAPLREQFASYLKDTALSVSASCIAEEFNENAVKNNMASCSTAQSVAATLKITHLFCSPSIAERRRLGLTKCACQEDFAKHEKYWLNVLIANNVGNTVFLCGHSHVSSFRSLLSNNSYDVNVLVDYYRQDCFC